MSEVTWNFCTLICTFGAISSVTKASPTSMILPRMPPVVTTSSPADEFRHHRLVLFGLLLLRADEQEVKDGDEHHHHQDEGDAATGRSATGASAPWLPESDRS